jgi:hypothetical protein
MEKEKQSGFIYLWFDSQTKMFYLGSHKGTLDDGYTGSNNYFKSAFKKRPQAFKRRILEFVFFTQYQELRDRENHWLSMIKPEELGVKYYNFKNVAFGGDIISNLSEKKKKEHARKSGLASRKYWDNISKEDYLNRQKTAFGGNKFSRNYMKKRQQMFAKTALIMKPDGNIVEVKNVADFCKKHNLNYGNMKSVLREERKSCNGYKGSYV